MRYKVDGVEIRSENAAKPWSQASEHLVAWLSANVKSRRALDFGCGKLRYAVHLRRCAESLVVVDSEHQLSREQVIDGELCTIYSFVKKNWPNVTPLNSVAFSTANKRFDFILCANVLSAIPSRRVRTDVLNQIRCALSAKGSVLFVTQYSNSYFREIGASGRARDHLDGWLLPSIRGYAYYGILSLEKVAKLCSAHGLDVERRWQHGGSAYVLARARSSNKSLHRARRRASRPAAQVNRGGARR